MTPSKTARVGIIGGTGLGDALLAQGGEAVHVETPFGPPSDLPIVAKWEGVDVAFLSRHGPGHRLNPSKVPYRANIWALKQLGVSAIIASGATGSLREDIEPGHLVLCDQVIDKTFGRASTFFEEGLVAHVEFADPFCVNLRTLLVTAGKRVSTTVHHAGTYVCMEGPQFSSRAESNMHRQWGGDVIGMTCMPEAKLAREAEICYALIGLPTDYDCWRPVDPSRGPDDLLPEILANLRRATDNAIALIRETLKLIKGPPTPCKCQDALKLAIWSDKRHIDPAVRKRLDPLIGRYLADNDGTMM
jgi:5'-methylthioadenosine phosphorylase